MHLSYICSPRAVGLVDYDDDEDDEDYKPPPRKQLETDEDEGTMESLRLKRQLASKDKEPELVKKQRLGKNSKSKDSVFAALCSTLSHAVLPSKKTASTVHATSSPTADGDKSLGEENHQENELEVAAVSRSCEENNSSSDEENHRENESAASRSCTERLHGTSDNRQLGGEDCSLLPLPKSSPEMTVNGS